MAQAQAGKQAEAIASLRIAVSLAPLQAAARLHLAELYLAAGDRKEASRLLLPLEGKKLGSKEQETFKRLSNGVTG